MNRIKTLLIVSIVLALSLSMIGCNLLPSGSSTDVETGSLEMVPQWLTLAHRAEATEQPEIVVEENGDEDEAAETPAATEPAATQSATTQPAPQPAPQPSGTPRYLQAGTMEYLAKLQLDQAAKDYKQLNIRLGNETGTDEKADIRAQMRYMLTWMNALATEIGLDLKATYGLTPPAAAAGSGGFEHDWNTMGSPSGFGQD